MGWMDLARLTDDESGGLQLGNFFTRSINRRAQNPGAADPIGNTRLPRAQEAPITSMTEPWKPQKNRHTMEAFETPAMTDYLKHIQNAPTHSEYAPSIWHRIVGSIGGAAEGGTRGALAGMKTALDITELPYRRAVQDYEIKGQSLESAAKLEEAGNRTRQAYQKAIMEQDEADKDREVKWANSEINRIKAEQAARRITLQAEIDRATNQVAVDRLTAQRDKWERDSQAELDRLEIMKQDADTRRYSAESGRMTAGASVTNAATNQQNANTNSRRADYYGQGIRNRNQPRPMTPASVGITRRIVEEELMNENPTWLNSQGIVKPEFRKQYEDAIQRRLLMRIPNYNFNRELEPESNDDDNPYEVIQ
jgi:hypothetical protein